MLEVVYRNAVSLNEMIHKLLEFNRIDRKEDSMLIVSRIELVSFVKNIYAVYKEADVEENINGIFPATPILCLWTWMSSNLSQ